MEKVSILWVCGEFIVNKLSLKGFLGCDDKGRLSSTSTDTAHEVIEFAWFSKDMWLNVWISTESSVVLGHGEQQKSTITSIET